MFLFKKKVETVKDSEIIEVDAVKTWKVRWQSRHGEYKSDTLPEVEVFLSEYEALQFAQDLKSAFKIIRHTSGDEIKVSEV